MVGKLLRELGVLLNSFGGHTSFRKAVRGPVCLVIGGGFGDIACNRRQYQNQSHGAKAGEPIPRPRCGSTTCAGVIVSSRPAVCRELLPEGAGWEAAALLAGDDGFGRYWWM
jgi:hypothetical protein